jgi:hypothetical protein
MRVGRPSSDELDDRRRNVIEVRSRLNRLATLSQ